VFSYRDLVRVEIAMDAEERFGVTIADAEADSWPTLGDLSRLVAGRSGGRATEAEVFDWVSTLMREAYGATIDLTPEGDVFADYEEVIGWFMSRKRPRRSSPEPPGA
jgi:hypothetical protein